MSFCDTFILIYQGADLRSSAKTVDRLKQEGEALHHKSKIYLRIDHFVSFLSLVFCRAIGIREESLEMNCFDSIPPSYLDFDIDQIKLILKTYLLDTSTDEHIFLTLSQRTLCPHLERLLAGSLSQSLGLLYEGLLHFCSTFFS
ncbi:uncharacterized protein N7479_001606 [Penicillium vulpinum]|uniref:uncharacterized protein n=1 Tax=Penicillium vulpinum TaxID=29845 RepID=UPI0025472A31|nr:uncharacterized protein N7479_001606 [Penicillium vulpinum]KAJ5971688.1 hypothetical protein N7479_001606 [Penicillium vulpinum]